MIMHIVYRAKNQSVFEQLGNFFGEIASVLKYLIPIVLGIITMLIYFTVVPLSILAIVFVFINVNYKKRLPARAFVVSAVICWLWLAVIVLL